MSRARIKDWYNHYGGQVYMSFSGGKDSTVLLDLVRNVCGYTDVPAVFANTGLEYPEIVKFVKTFDNVEIIRPKMNFRQVIETYGYPFFSKETSEVVYNAKIYLQKLAESKTIAERTKLPYKYAYDRLKGQGKYSKISTSHTELENSVDLVNLAKTTDKWEMPYRVARLMGTYETYWEKKKKGIIPKDGELSKARYSQERYQFMLNAPFDISHMCCNVMKKKPVHKYAKETGRKGMTGQMAAESLLRTQKWLQNGCNGFDLKEPISNPMAFWTEQDVLEYIKKYNITICSVYGDIVEDLKGTGEVAGQMTFSDMEGIDTTDFDAERPKLKTTGCNRTGCMFCGYGCHLEKPGEGRFERMKKTHPKQWEWIMKPWEQGGLGYRDIINWINEHGNMDIRTGDETE